MSGKLESCMRAMRVLILILIGSLTVEINGARKQWTDASQLQYLYHEFTKVDTR